MTSSELRKKYLAFFAKNGHAMAPSCPLVPDNDPTTLFVSAGMQQMIPYLSGEKHPLGARLANCQRCLRTQDIEEVGDNRHTTFFEMLGNWSLNDYFKKEQLGWIFEFLTSEAGLDPKNIYVTVFRGSEECGIPRDAETAAIWKELFSGAGIKASDVDFSEKNGMGDGRIFYYDERKNWWSRSGVPGAMPEGELGGPDSEIFWDFGTDLGLHEKSPWASEPCHVNCDCGRFMEIGNSVFMEYIKRNGRIEKMATHNVDFGGGLERIAAAHTNNYDVFKLDLFLPLIETIERFSQKKYGSDPVETAAMRVIADHIRAATFLIADGIVPSNKAQGYFARRLIRRAVVKGHQLGVENNFLAEIAKKVSNSYQDVYHLPFEAIGSELDKEETKFRKTLAEGLKELNYILGDLRKILAARDFAQEKEMVATDSSKLIDETAKKLFFIYQSYGFPFELSIEELEKDGRSVIFKEQIKEKFNNYAVQHQELSRTASAGMFKGGLADAGEQTTRLHTAAHLMLAALRQVLGDTVLQKGSNITAERLRFDFSYAEKMTPEQIKQVEYLVNGQIAKNIPIDREEMSLEDAKSSGAMGVFGSKYGDRVTVYAIGGFSREICGGPHVKNTGELGNFKIIKEESSGAGVRRIKAVLEENHN